MCFDHETKYSDSGAGWAVSQTTHHCNQIALTRSEGETKNGGEVEGEIYSSDCSRYSIDWIQIDVYIMPLLCYVKVSI